MPCFEAAEKHGKPLEIKQFQGVWSFIFNCLEFEAIEVGIPQIKHYLNLFCSRSYYFQLPEKTPEYLTGIYLSKKSFISFSGSKSEN